MLLPDLIVEPGDIVKQLTKQEALTLKKGSVILVRSDYANEKYGDHASLLVGGVIKKERGMRPNLVTLPNALYNIRQTLNQYKPLEDGAIILLLSNAGAAKLLERIGIHLSEGELYNPINVKGDVTNY